MAKTSCGAGIEVERIFEMTKQVLFRQKQVNRHDLDLPPVAFGHSEADWQRHIKHEPCVYELRDGRLILESQLTYPQWNALAGSQAIKQYQGDLFGLIDTATDNLVLRPVAICWIGKAGYFWEKCLLYAVYAAEKWGLNTEKIIASVEAALAEVDNHDNDD